MRKKKTKKQKKKASVVAIKSANMKIVDPIERAINNFISTYKNKIMFLRFNRHCFIKVKVIERNTNSIFKFENVTVKVIQKSQKWIKELKYGSYSDTNGKLNKFSLIKKGSLLVVNHLSLVDKDKLNEIIDSLKEEYISNKNSLTTKLKFIDESLYQISSVEKYLEERLGLNEGKENSKNKSSSVEEKRINKSKNITGGGRKGGKETQKSIGKGSKTRRSNS